MRFDAHKIEVRIVLFTVMVAIAAALAVGIHRSPVGHGLENRVLDWRFLVRNDARSQALGLYNPPPVHPDIVIIGLDRKSYETIPDASLKWNPLYAAVFTKVGEAGNKALGIDLLQTVPLDDIQPGGDDELAGAFAMTPGVVFVYPIKPATSKSGSANRMGTPDDPAENGYVTPGVAQYSIWLSSEKYQGAFTPNNAGNMNLLLDSDGTVRRHALMRGLEASDKGGVTSVPAFAFQLLCFYTGVYKNIGESEKLRSIKAEDFKAAVPFSVGPYTIRWDENFSIRINYAGPGFTFPYVSFVDCLEAARRDDKAFFEKHFKGKIVLVGEADPLVFADMKMTPYFGADNKETPGIEVHANVLNTIMSDIPLNETTENVNVAIIVLAAMAAGLLVYAGSPTFASLRLTGGILLLAWLSCFLFSRYATIIPTVGPICAMILAGIVVLVLRIMLIDRKATVLRSVFEKYVHPHVVSQIINNPHQLSLGGDKKIATILFSDVNNFTTMSHDMDPEHVISLLNEYFEIMTRVIMKHEGTLQAFLGDGIMCVFNAPVEQKDHALRAARTAIEMMEELESWMERRKANGDITFWIKIGINTGHIVAGNLGSHLRMEYTSIGDAVNLSARIMDATKGVKADILVSESTYELIKDEIECVDKGNIKVKGVEDLLHVYEVIGIKGSNRPKPQFPGEPPNVVAYLAKFPNETK